VLLRKLGRVWAAMAALGFPMMPTDGVRTAEAQAALYAQGRTKPGHIVTNCDGVTTKSNHQVKDDGVGHAVDCAFLDANGQPSWEDHFPWSAYGEAAKAVGLIWGIHLNATTIDRPHVELPRLT
jgi:hypothetical protein